MMASLKCLRKDDDLDLMIITDSGIIIKLPLEQVSTLKRATQGVRLINLKDGQKVSTVALVVKEEEENESQENTNEVLSNVDITTNQAEKIDE